MYAFGQDVEVIKFKCMKWMETGCFKIINLYRSFLGAF